MSKAQPPTGPAPVGSERYWGELPESGASSRLPKHKRADSGNGRENRYTAGFEYSTQAKTRRLATKPGIKLRDEVLEESDGERRAVSWAKATDAWREWMYEVRDTKAIFERQDTDEPQEVRVPLENRFMESRQEQVYAKFHDVARGARERYGKALTTVMLTFTASTKSGAGQWDRCPANHLDDLLGSWPAVRRELHRTLEGRDWEYARILEPHESGHAHVHLAVFVRGPVRQDAFRGVMKAHVDNTLAAGWDAHRPDGDAVSVRDGRQNGQVDNIAAYLSSYVMNYGDDPLKADESEQKFNALLWATGRRRWSLSDGAQEWASFEAPPSEGEWKLTAVEVVDSEYPIQGGGEPVLMLPLDESGAGLDPPPDRGGPP